MKVVLMHPARFPVLNYGGTERVIWWLAKGLSEKNINVVLACLPKSHCPFAEVFYPDFKKPLESQIDADLFHFFATPNTAPQKPHVVTVGGNGRPNEFFLENTIFVSRNHAERHGSRSFVYNGVDPQDYIFQDKKQNHLIFLAKASWKVKNVRGAIRIARKAATPMKVVGGHHPLRLKSWRGIQWEGMKGGMEKAKLISNAKALLFPVLWDEPFGLAVVESLISGTPVLAPPFGSLPELISADVGFLCKTETEFIEGIQNIQQVSAHRCREWAMEKFTYTQMTKNYLKAYETVLAGNKLNSVKPFTQQPPKVYAIPASSPMRRLPSPFA